MRFLLAALGAFTAATVCWIVWGVTTSGDYFGNGAAFVYLTILVAAVLGAYAAFRSRSRSLRTALLIMTVVCGLFWTIVPNGWWAKAPPPAASK